LYSDHTGDLFSMAVTLSPCTRLRLMAFSAFFLCRTRSRTTHPV
jgi:hypothetical protein